MMSDKVSFRKTARWAFSALAVAGALGSASLLSAMAPRAQAANGSPAAAVQPGQLSDADKELGRQLYNDWSCGSCHLLKDAGGAGHVGPAFDGNVMTLDYSISRITNGQGAMPAFGGIMTDEEIAILSAYIIETSEKPR